MDNAKFPILLTGAVEPLPPISIQMDGATHRLVFRAGMVRLRAESEQVLQALKTVADGKTYVAVIGRYERVESSVLLVHQVSKIERPLRKHALAAMLDPGDAWPYQPFALIKLSGGDDSFPNWEKQ